MESSDDSIRTVPIFLKKLWRMVNDPESSDVIEWNYTGDGFIIHNQLTFMFDYLPKYFKHNNMSSFVRQLNLYGFHKLSTLKDEIQFTHNYFLKDVPAMLTFIKRKPVSTKTKTVDLMDPLNLEEILSNIKEMKNKHNLVENELKALKQENAALWSEMSNLRVKHVNQSKIINKLIRFLITYMHSTSQAPVLNENRAVKESSNTQKPASNGPTIFELDSNGSALDFWKKFDERNCNPYVDLETNTSTDKAIMFKNCNPYTVTEPTTSTGNQYQLSEPTSSKSIGSFGNNEKGFSITANELMDTEDSRVPFFDSEAGELMENFLDSGQNENNQPGTSTAVAINNFEKPATKENIGMYIDNTQVELENLQEILTALNNKELDGFCKVLEDNEVWLRKEKNVDSPDTAEDSASEIFNETPTAEVNNFEFNLDSVMPELSDLLNTE